jgi:hypothetical protein
MRSRSRGTLAHQRGRMEHGPERGHRTQLELVELLRHPLLGQEAQPSRLSLLVELVQGLRSDAGITARRTPPSSRSTTVLAKSDGGTPAAWASAAALSFRSCSTTSNGDALALEELRNRRLTGLIAHRSLDRTPVHHRLQAHRRFAGAGVLEQTPVTVASDEFGRRSATDRRRRRPRFWKLRARVAALPLSLAPGCASRESSIRRLEWTTGRTGIPPCARSRGREPTVRRGRSQACRRGPRTRRGPPARG